MMYTVRCSTMDLGHFTVVLANFIATFRLYSDNLLESDNLLQLPEEDYQSIIETLQ